MRSSHALYPILLKPQEGNQFDALLRNIVVVALYLTVLFVAVFVLLDRKRSRLPVSRLPVVFLLLPALFAAFPPPPSPASPSRH